MTSIHRRLHPVRSRQQGMRLAQYATSGLLFGGLLGLFDSLGRLSFGYQPSALIVIGLLIASPILGVVLSFFRMTTFRQAASAVDDYYGLKDRSTTALLFLDNPEARTIHLLQLEDAESHLAKVEPQVVAPWKTPRTAKWALASTIAVLAILAISIPSPIVSAALVVNDVVLAQASRASEQIELLQKQNEDDQDPEIEQLIEKLKAKVEELAEPGVDIKEAMAVLSEMQAAILEQQQQLEESSTEQALQSVGDALSMAGAMSASGSALAAGNYAKASEELDKIDQMPELDRQSNRTVTEKLDKSRDQMAGGKLQSLRDAVENLTQGLSSAKGDKFGDGIRGLSGESKKQGRRKKLSELLRNQNDALEESKSDVEKESRESQTSTSGGKGGNEWGLGKSGNNSGEKTPSLNAQANLQLKGQEGDQGDVDSETSHSPERRERGQRGYKEKFERSQKLNDSVLDSEPIPLGHRQTIRRYFELIRPQQGEMDEVKDKMDSK